MQTLLGQTEIRSSTFLQAPFPLGQKGGLVPEPFLNFSKTLTTSYKLLFFPTARN